MPRVLNHRTATPEERMAAVYVGRPSKWGNPYFLGYGLAYYSTDDDRREKCIGLFEDYARGNFALCAAARRELRGRDLLCFCAPKHCHADFWLRVANAP